jgi:hypothetical protein
MAERGGSGGVRSLSVVSYGSSTLPCRRPEVRIALGGMRGSGGVRSPSLLSYPSSTPPRRRPQVRIAWGGPLLNQSKAPTTPNQGPSGPEARRAILRGLFFPGPIWEGKRGSSGNGRGGVRGGGKTVSFLLLFTFAFLKQFLFISVCRCFWRQARPQQDDQQTALAAQQSVP